MTERHAFALPVYGKPPYLNACIESILQQSQGRGRIIMSTSTPSEFLDKVAARYAVPLLVNPCRADIATDWNFALSHCDADFVTIAHQDDLYDRAYAETMCDALQRHPDTSIAFSGFREHGPDGPRRINVNIRIKRWMCARAFGANEALELPRDKLSLLTLGNPICCPSVVINRKRLSDFRFAKALKTNLDWEAWVRIARLPGKFVYVRAPLISKCVHPESETSATIANRVRENEDRYMFEQFWPKPVASAILAFYKLGYLANRT